MKQFYQIHELAKLFDLCPDTLRYYEEKGLLHPVRGENRYRMYGIQDVCTLNIIRALRELKIPTRAIRAYLERRSVGETLSLLDREEALLRRRMAELDVTAFVQPVFINGDMHIAPGRLGGNRLAHSYAWGDMERLGLHMAFGTDCPVERFHPLEGVYCAVTRRDFTGNGPFLPEQALTPYQALYAYTAGGAYASGEERIKGRIRSGLLADFLLVDRNLLTCPPEELLSARVLRTYVGGACVFRDPSF